MGIDLTDDDGPHGGGKRYLDPGWHTVKVDSAKEITSKSNGNPGYEYSMSNGDGMITRKFWVTPNAKFMLKNFALCCGYKGNLRDYDYRSILGTKVQVEVALKPAQDGSGKQYREVVNYIPLTAPAHGENSDDESF